MEEYTVYKHTSPSGKVYIGITRQRPSKRYCGGNGYRHCSHMQAAINKYGWEQFTHEVLFTGLCHEEAEAKERELIRLYESDDPKKGYNIAPGGGVKKGEMPAVTRAKLRAHMLGDNNPTRRYGHPFLGKRHTDEAKAAMKQAAKERIRTPCSDEKRAKLHEANAELQTPVICKDTGAIYEGIRAAAKITGLSATKICAVCRGKRKSTGGLRWEYAKEAKANG